MPGWFFDSGDLPVFDATSSVRLASNAVGVAAVQALRYQIFYEEMSARPSAAQAETARIDDLARFAPLILTTPRQPWRRTRLPSKPLSAATPVAPIGCRKPWRVYSADEFDLNMLENAGRGLNIMELVVCVAPEYRTKHGIDLMWHGLGAMVSHYGIDA